MQQNNDLTNGPAAAAILAAGIGSLALGLFVILAEASSSVNNALNFYDPVGPLSGKTTLAIIIWILSWMILHSSWKNKQVGFAGVFTVSLILIVLGLLGTFPPFFDLFGG
ncbi:MAG: hypothetical protein WC769_02905 [Thermodesulfovibrionales bacterium]|jgi:hypothetical protein